MFDASQTIIDAFVGYLLRTLHEQHPGSDAEIGASLERTARTALDALNNCDCPYHDLEHTVLVTDAGLSILRGRQLRVGDLNARSWLQAVAAMLCHDVGYVRGLLKEDHEGSYVADISGRRVNTPATATDAALTPYHVNRGSLFVLERFDNDPMIDAHTVADYIEMTRFPVPHESHYQETDTLAALVRAADLIGQMGDPSYPVKQARLFAEFQETGEARRLGVTSASDLRTSFPTFFYQQVYPYVTTALDYLNLTREGRQWTANLFHHLHGSAASGSDRSSQWAEMPEARLFITDAGQRIAASNQ
ncbi:MAG: hypothetical protein KF911_04650 [Pseudomonadales bacterium]|nr:hypothetical protein [Pseudomonadales bacterium]